MFENIIDRRIVQKQEVAEREGKYRVVVLGGWGTHRHRTSRCSRCSVGRMFGNIQIGASLRLRLQRQSLCGSQSKRPTTPNSTTRHQYRLHSSLPASVSLSPP